MYHDPSGVGTRLRYALGRLLEERVKILIFFMNPTSNNPDNYVIRITDASFNALGNQPSGFGVTRTIMPND